ncbi:MAG TPA: phosphotransferase [Solirubrobacteraceae bacterium]|nr:phosphotransferase [Solirubrobacteraceae bacterium]
MSAAVTSAVAVAEAIEAFPAPAKPPHGDAGLRNARSPSPWNDWEDAVVGPVEWDLACLVTSARVTGERREVAEAALAAYGAPLPEPFVRARGLQVVAWSGLAAAAGDARARLPARLAWLRGQLG